MNVTLLKSKKLFAGSTESVARRLLGCSLSVKHCGARVGGIIVETEAYLPDGDPACHAYRGPTPRNEVMFGAEGVLYVYSIHAGYCLNVVTEGAALGSAVLIRALQPVWGIAEMIKRRNRQRLTDLTSGPSKLCQALSIDTSMNGIEVEKNESVKLERVAGITSKSFKLIVTPRIGISKAQQMPLRFFVDRNPHVSGLKRWHSGPANQALSAD